MRFHLKNLLPVISVLLLLSCAETVVKEVPYAPSRTVPDTANPRPIKFSGIEVLLPPGTEVGLEGGQGRFCSYPRYPLDRQVINKAVNRTYIKQDFHDALEANGYDVVDSLDIAFRPEDEIQRAEYFVKAKVKDVDVDTCRRGPGFFGFQRADEVDGKFYMSVDWTVYDALRRQVVYKTTTEGYTKRNIPNLDGMTLMFHDAFEMAAHNLSADEDFYGLIVEGVKPPKGWRGGLPFGRRGLKDEPRKFNPNEAVNIVQQDISVQPVPKHIDNIRNSNVLIQKSGHGSGFFITKQGHILTNQHVVGDATRMRIVTKGKRHKLIAEVLRRDKVRDVALLKLEKIPDNLDIVVLPMRTDKATVGEDVYAIGNPYDYRALQDTLTKGIVSAHRMYKIDGIRLPFIQADVDIHGGNSGGALMDEYGNVIGMSVSGIASDGANGSLSTGLNFFIPISQALKAMDITLGGEKSSSYRLDSDEIDDADSDESYDSPIILED